MRILSSHNTTKGAKQFVPDEGICLRPRHRRVRTLAEQQEDREAREAAAKARREQEAAAEAERTKRLADRLAVMPANPRPKEIIAAIAIQHGVTVADILGSSRRRNIVKARHEAMAQVYDRCRVMGERRSLPDLGRIFGGRDHTTCLHALRKMRAAA